MQDDLFEEFREASAASPSETVPNPRLSYATPNDVIADAALSEAEKQEMLSLWAVDLNDRLKAEEEGMSAADPIDARSEGKLAHESGKVSEALSKLTMDQGQNCDPKTTRDPPIPG